MYLYLISKCQCHTARFVVGQNLYIYKQSRKSATTNWTRSITDWYDEVELFGKERVKPFKFSTDVGNHLKTKICIVHLWCFKSRICNYMFFSFRISWWQIRFLLLSLFEKWWAQAVPSFFELRHTTKIKAKKFVFVFSHQLMQWKMQYK